MLRYAIYDIVLCWLAWSWPFLFRAQRESGRRPAATVRAALWGLALEMAGIGMAWWFVPGPRATARLAAAMLLAPLGPILAWQAVEHLGRQLRIQAGLYQDHELVRTGPYGTVRHPIYASMLALTAATGMVMTSWPRLAVALAIFIAGTEIRVRIEDRLLAGRFGEQFETWRRRVPAYLPFIR